MSEAEEELFFFSGQLIPGKSIFESPFEIHMASINQLILLLTEAYPSNLAAKKAHTTFADVFFDTYRMVLTPDQLLQKVFDRYAAPMPEQTPEDFSAVKRSVLATLSYWFNGWPWDISFFMFERLLAFARQAVSDTTDGGEIFVAARYLHKLLTSRRDVHLSQIGRTPYSDTHPSTCAPPLQARIKVTADLPLPTVFAVVEPLEFARQITLGDHEIFRALVPAELLSQDWNSTDPSLKSKCPGLLAIIDRFNRVTGVVMHLVLSQKTLAKRKKLILKLIEIMQHLYDMGNLFGVIALSSCFSSGPIKRLKHTFASLGLEPLAKLDRFHHFSSPSNQYREYRAQLEKILPPAVPYLGSFLQELLYVNERRPTYKHGLIDFQKMKSISAIIQKVTVYQKRSFSFTPIFPIHSLINNYPLHDEDHLYDLSLALEPRNATKRNLK